MFKRECQVVAIKIYGRAEVWFHSFLTSALEVVIVNCTPLLLCPQRKKLLGNTEREAGWAPEWVRVLCRREKYFEMC